jgi:hypothetical protein
VIAVKLAHLGVPSDAEGGSDGALRGARMAPISSTCAWSHTRTENSGAKAHKTVIIGAGRVGIVAPPGRVATSLPSYPRSNG